MFGGVQAVTWTDVKQMVLIVVGLIAAVVVLIIGLPDEVGVVQALRIAGAAGRLQTFDFSFDLTNQYTFWSGTIAALVPVLLLLRHRPEPGAAVPDRPPRSTRRASRC